ncbi:TIGR02530 family flagellar biosynthesis protein [Paenibacillus protaetiae]|uniref:Flagellar biosynthesis protein n=1 Tax=Paenibacillus protaetiae TaxID=2509456 RepID=A0A4P6ET55_9BACL|nr:TIGR02530 family flagellar biosynthesis protein [Paenibacillus protaetiae]QAY65605.1 flagellar biosynthesis protein [Paenibacillus protaetiae]
MNDSIRIGQLYPVNQTPLAKGKPAPAGAAAGTGSSSFKELLESSKLKFSHHAEIRMKQRGIELRADSIAQINQAVEQAEQKGAVNSLIVYRDIAMIVNVPSRTVVTAMDGKQMESTVFTQIDSAVIVKEGRT